MATGDKAAAAGIPLVASTDPVSNGYIEHNLNRDLIAERAPLVQPISRGGTGATTAAAARTAIGADAAYIHRGGTSRVSILWASNAQGGHLRQYVDDTYQGELATVADVNKKVTNNSAGTNTIALRWDSAAGRLIPTVDTTDLGHVAMTADVNARLPMSGGFLTGDIRVPNVYLNAPFAASSGYTQAYINSDGRIARGASSIRYKDLLEDPDVSTLGGIFPTLRRFKMKDGDGKPILGYIAEELAANPDTEPFVVYAWEDGKPTEQPESIDFIQLLLAQNAALNARVAALEERLAAPE